MLTDAGRVCGIALLPLREQCRILGLQLRDHPRHRTQKSPELELMDAYAAASVPCCFTQGGILFVALYSLCFERLFHLGTAKWASAGYTATIMGKTRTPVQSWMYSSVIVYQEFLQSTDDLEGNLLSDIASVSVGDAMRNFEVLQSWQSNSTWFPHSYVGLTRELVELVLDLLLRRTLVDIARLFFSDPYAYVKGWPDLTLVENGEVQFVEVKTTDRLHASQIITIGEMKAAAGVNVSVVRLVG